MGTASHSVLACHKRELALMGKTINEILEEQKVHRPIIGIMGNPTRDIFTNTSDTCHFPETFLEYLLNLTKQLTYWNK